MSGELFDSSTWGTGDNAMSPRSTQMSAAVRDEMRGSSRTRGMEVRRECCPDEEDMDSCPQIVGDIRVAFLEAAKTGDWRTVTRILESTSATDGVEELLACKDPQEGCTALIWACSCGHRKTSQVLVKACDTKQLDATCGRMGRTALIWASAEGHADIVGTLLASKADPGSCSFNGWTALNCAALEDRVEVVQMMVDNGLVDLQLPDKTPTKSTALEWALWAGHNEVSTILSAASAVNRLETLDSSLQTGTPCADTKQARPNPQAILSPDTRAVQARAELSEAAAQSLRRQQARANAMKARADAVHCADAVGCCPQDEAALGEQDKAAVGEQDEAAVGEQDEAAVGEQDEAAVGEQDEVATEAAVAVALSAIERASTARKLLRTSSEKSPMSPQILSSADMHKLYAHSTSSSSSSLAAPDRRAVGAQPPDTSLSPSQSKHCDKSIPLGRDHFCDVITETDLLDEATEQELKATAAEQDYQAAAAAVSLLSESIGAKEASLIMHDEEMDRAKSEEASCVSTKANEASCLSNARTVAQSNHNSEHSVRENDSVSHSPRSFITISSLSPGTLDISSISPCTERGPEPNERSHSKARHALIGQLRSELSEVHVHCSQLTHANEQNKSTIAQLQLQQTIHDEAQRVQEELVAVLKTELLEVHDEAQRVQAALKTELLEVHDEAQRVQAALKTELLEVRDEAQRVQAALKTELLEAHDEAQRVQAELMPKLKKEQEWNSISGESVAGKAIKQSCLDVDTVASLRKEQLLSAREEALQQQQHALNAREWGVKELEAEAFSGDQMLQQQLDQADQMLQQQADQADRLLQQQVEQALVIESAAKEKIEMLESLVSQLRVELQVEAERWMRAAMDAGAATEEMKTIAASRDETASLLRSQEQKTELLQAALVDQISKMQGDTAKVKQTEEDICRQAVLLEDKQQDYDQVRKELDSIEGVVRALEQVIETKSSMIAQGEEELESAQVEIVYLTSELQKATKPDQGAAKELERSIEHLKSTNLQLESSLALSSEQCVALETEVRELTDAKRDDRAKVSRLQEAVHSVQRMTAKGSIEDLKSQLSLLQVEAGILKDQNQSYQNRLSDGARRHESQIRDSKAELSIWKAKHQSMVEYIKSFSELNLDSAPAPAGPVLSACGSDSAEMGVLQAKLAFFREKLGDSEHEQLQMTKACHLAHDKAAELAAQLAKGKLEIVHLQGCLDKSKGVAEGTQNDTCLDSQQLSLKLEQAEKKLVEQEEASGEKQEEGAGALRSLVQCLKWIHLLGNTSHKLLRRLHMDNPGTVLIHTEAFGSTIQRAEHQLSLDGPSTATSGTGALQAECVEAHGLVKAIVLAANESHSHRSNEEPILSNRSHEAREHKHRVNDWSLAQQQHQGGYSAQPLSARGGYLTARESIEQARRLEAATRPRPAVTSSTVADTRPLTTREYIAQTQFDGLPRRADPRDSYSPRDSYTTAPEHRAAQPTPPRVTVAIDANGDGRADCLVSGVDRNNDGIPDVLQGDQPIHPPSRISPRDALKAPPDTDNSLVSTPVDYLLSTPPMHVHMGGLARGLGAKNGGLIPKLDFSKLRN